MGERKTRMLKFEGEKTSWRAGVSGWSGVIPAYKKDLMKQNPSGSR